MSLNRLPNELIYIIANHLDYVSNLNALAQTSRRFSFLLNDILYGKNSWSIAGPALQWAAERGDVAKASRLLEHGAHPDLLTDEEVDGLQALAMIDERYAPKEFEKRPPLSTAALHGHLAVVNLLLEKGADPERHDLSTKWTPISWAIEGGHGSVVQVLLAHGAKVAMSSVNLAMEKGNVELVKILLEANPKLLQSEASYRTTILTKAAERKGNIEMLRFLVNQGLDPTITDGIQFSPLNQAACSGDLEMVQYLLTQGFNPESLAQSLDGMRLWPIQWAAIAGHKNVVEYSLSVINLERSDYVSYLRILASAAAVGLEDVVQELINTGGFSGYKLEGRSLPVHACFHPLDIAIQRGQTGVVRILLDNGADPTLGEQGRRNTPLFVAIKRGHLDLVQLLLDRGADLHKVEEYQDESLLAHAQPFPAIFKLLLERGANVHHSAWNPGDLSIPMIAAMEGGNMAQVNMLRERGVQLEPQNSPHAKDSLLRAVQGGLSMMRLWAERYELPRGGRLEAETTNAAFHLAVAHGNHEVVQYFFELGYRLTMEDHNQLRITINRMKTLATFPETLEVLMQNGLDLARLSGCWIAISDSTEDKLRVLRYFLEKGLDPVPASPWGHEMLRWSIHCHLEAFFIPILLEAITAKCVPIEEIHRNLLRIEADFSLRQSPSAVRLWRNFYWRSRYPVPI